MQGLLVYLALTQPQPHPRALLATLFWPDEPEAVANQNLRQSLFRLRKVLGDLGVLEDADSQPAPYLLVSRSTVQFNAAGNHLLDVTRFLAHLGNGQLESAAALYQGDLLAGFSCDSMPFDEWLRQERERLHRLHYAAVRWAEEGVPILLLLGLRQEAVNESPDVQSWLARLNHSVSVLPVQLNELSQTETAQLMQTLLEAESGQDAQRLTQFSDWIFAETAGQPLFLTETLKALVDNGVVQPNKTSERWQLDGAKFAAAVRDGEGHFGRLSAGHITPGIQQIIQGWLARISPSANKVLAAAAILTQARTFDQLCAVAGLEEIDALHTLDELLAKQLLLEEHQASSVGGHESTYNFSPQKVSEVVYRAAGAARRRILHRRAFETLQSRAVPAADLAPHALNAGLLVETIRFSLIAGNEAMDIFATRVALRHYETIWQVTEQKGWPEEVSGADRQAFYVGLGRAYELAAKWQLAQQSYQSLITYAQTNGATASSAALIGSFVFVLFCGSGTFRKPMPVKPFNTTRPAAIYC